MSEYEHTEIINAEPLHVFDYISDVINLPKYLPTVQNAISQAGDRVRVQGDAGGHHYDSDGFYHVDHNRMRMDWGSDGENQYRGWMQVKDGGNGTNARITVHLSFEPRPDIAQRFEQQSGDRHRTIQEGLVKALQSVKNLCEGHGGKVESRYASNQTVDAR